MTEWYDKCKICHWGYKTTFRYSGEVEVKCFYDEGRLGVHTLCSIPELGNCSFKLRAILKYE